MSKLSFNKRDNYSRCKNSAIYSLAMREHSRYELLQKLKKKEYAVDVDLNKLLDELEKRDYQSDTRFTESFIRYRVSRGQGRNKILNELKARGVRPSIINKSISESEVDWFKLAKEQHRKKFGAEKTKDFKEKAKQMRFLFGRGFDSETIRATVD